MKEFMQRIERQGGVKSEDDFTEGMVLASKHVMKAMLLCTCVAYDRLREYPRWHNELFDVDTELGGLFLKEIMPIVERRNDTIDAFLKDMMFATRNFIQLKFEGEGDPKFEKTKLSKEISDVQD